MKRPRRWLILTSLAAALPALGSGAARAAYAPNVGAYVSGNHTGPVQGMGYACMSYGSLDSMWMTLQGPSGTEEWQWQAQNAGSGGCRQNTLAARFEYDSDYFLIVFACGSDDDGYACTSDTRSFRTPARQPGDPDPPGSSEKACLTEPCPFITGPITPLPVHLGDSGTLTIPGANLQNITAVLFDTAPGMHWGGGPNIEGSVLSATQSQVTIAFHVPYNPSIYGIRYIILCDSASLPNCTSAYPYPNGYPFSVAQ